MKNNEIMRRLSGGRMWLAVAAMSLGIILLMFAVSGGEDARREDDVTLTELEAKLTRLCERVSGVSEVTVAVSLDGERLAGVGVVCVGGDDPRIRRELTELIGVSCDLGSNKIFITGAEKSVGPS